ncbi:hypothetical protein KR200_006579, partial [Drosophila serrata]
MKRIHVDNYVPKYYSGTWSWDSNKDSLHFEPHNDLENVRERYIVTNGFRFLRTMDQEEELIFRQEYMRDKNTFDGDMVIISDIIDLVLYLMPPNFLTYKLVEFLHQPQVDQLVHSLIIYFEHYLRMVEFVMIRRDEVSGQMAQTQSEQTSDMKRTLSVYLSQYRMLVARNYCELLQDKDNMAKFYHLNMVVKLSDTIGDKFFHEKILAILIQIVWISMHRRAYFVIEMEMNRLFRSDHFVPAHDEYPVFSPIERSLLYGRNKKNVNYRAQESPLIQELKLVPTEDLPILWIGKRKYRGTDIRIAEMELEYIVPASQLCLIDVAHGILGHPKHMYNTILSLNWPSVRFLNFSEEFDPYRVFRQPLIEIPKMNWVQIRKMNEHYEHFYSIRQVVKPVGYKRIAKWVKRSGIIEFFKSGGLITNVVSRAEQELTKTFVRPKVDQIVARYFKVMGNMRKV